MTAIQYRGLRLVNRVFPITLLTTFGLLFGFGILLDALSTVSSLVLAGLSLAGALLLSAIFSFVIWQFVTRRLHQISEAIRRVGEGDLSAVANVAGRDEFGLLAKQFNKMAGRIRDHERRRDALVDEIKESVRTLSTSSAGILKISNDQAANANQQASAVQEASTTSKEIAVTAKEITNNANSVQDMAEQSTQASGQGAKRLRSAMDGMKTLKLQVEGLAEKMVELGENSQKIGGVINIIGEISEQTNLLALNAAIEAAGAGEAGKRFGVVAQEVRRLAEKTVDATKQIQGFIEKIQHSTNTTIMVTEQGLKAVDSSYHLVEAVGQALTNIDDQVERTTRAAKEITFSTQQQTSACEQMAITISEVSQVAEHFVHGTEETAESIAQLNDLAAHLKSLVK